MRMQTIISILQKTCAVLLAVVFCCSAFAPGTLAWSDYSQHKTNVFSGQEHAVSVVLTKYEKNSEGALTGRFVSGAAFHLYMEKDGGDVRLGGVMTSNGNGLVILRQLVLAPGNYYFLEIDPSYGYAFDTDGNGDPVCRYSFAVTGDEPPGETIYVNAFNQREEAFLTLSKTVRNADVSPLTQEQLEQEFAFTVTFSDGGTYPYTITSSLSGLSAEELPDSEPDAVPDMEIPPGSGDAGDAGLGEIPDPGMPAEPDATPAPPESLESPESPESLGSPESCVLPGVEGFSASRPFGESKVPLGEPEFLAYRSDMESETPPAAEEPHELVVLSAAGSSTSGTTAATEAPTGSAASAETGATGAGAPGAGMSSGSGTPPESGAEAYPGAGASPGSGAGTHTEPGAEAPEFDALPESGTLPETEASADGVSETGSPETGESADSEAATDLVDALSGDYASGDILYLKHGQTVVIGPLPVGVQYTVRETPADGYGISGENHQGNIPLGGASVDFVNTFVGSEVGPGAVLTVTKQVEGDLLESLSEKLFDFTVIIGGTEHRISLRAGETSAPFALPYGALYEVYEEDCFADGFIQSLISEGYGTGAGVDVEAAVTNTCVVGAPPVIGCEVDKDTIRLTSAAFVSPPNQEGYNHVGEDDERYRYDIDFRSTSSVAASEFVVDDPLENVSRLNQVRVEELWTPVVWGDMDGEFEVLYRTNKMDAYAQYIPLEGEAYPNTGFRIWPERSVGAGPLLTTVRYHLYVSDIGLAQDEYLTAIRFRYGEVEAGFTSKNTLSVSKNGEHRDPGTGALDLQSGNAGVIEGLPVLSPLAGTAGITPEGDGTVLSLGTGITPEGDGVDWRPAEGRPDYRPELEGVTGLKPASYLVSAARPMCNEDIVSSASAKIAFGAMLDQDLDAVVTREIPTFEVNPMTSEAAGTIMEESSIEDANVGSFVVRGNVGMAPVGNSGDSVTDSGETAAAGGKASKTGDEAPLAFLITLIIASLAAIICLLARMAWEKRKLGVADGKDAADAADGTDAEDGTGDGKGDTRKWAD